MFDFEINASEQWIVPFLEIDNLSLEFGSGPSAVRVLDGVSLSLDPGEVLCLVGESGSGKSVTAQSITRLLPSPPAKVVGGRIMLEGQNVLTLPERELWKIRGRKVAYIFQEPGTSLNPVMRVGSQIQECIRSGDGAATSVVELLTQVGIPAPELRSRDYPHQLSGGMQQRVMIAMAIASRPKILVADEPTTALDVTIQAQILDLLKSLRKSLGMGILLITHNLGVVSEIADRVAVMYAGQIVETGTAHQILRSPRHPYTRALLDSVPRLGANADRLEGIPGNVPQPGAMPSGCRFHPRCHYRKPECEIQAPTLEVTESGHEVRCPFWRTIG